MQFYKLERFQTVPVWQSLALNIARADKFKKLGSQKNILF